MIARLSVAMPFAMIVPEGGQYKSYTYEDDGYVIVARAPGKSDLPLPFEVPKDVKVDGQPAFAANAIQFDFGKTAGDFDRRREGGVVEPPPELMARVVSSFIARLRYVARGAHLQPVELPHGTAWRLQYLNDDGSELPEDPALWRAFGAFHWSFSFVGVTPPVWDHMYTLEPDWVAPVWDDILLDALNALPTIGTAVVLAATALEVFIADILDRLAQGGDVPTDLWKWLNDRKNWLKDPSTDEQFDILLKHFVGQSLKDDAKLWQAFQGLRTARNTFVHEGRAMVGGKALNLDDARQLVAQASQIVQLIRGWLPKQHQWEQFEAKMDLSIALPLA